MLIIRSTQNKTIKYISSLQAKKKRDEEKKFIIEGERFVDAIPDGWEIDCFAVSESFTESKADLVKKYECRGQVFYVADNIFKNISDTVNPQGVLAVCSQKEYNLSRILQKEKPFIIILEEIKDPGNMGTIIRTADAAGADAIVISNGCVDVYNPKVLRSTAGSIFNIPFVCGVCLDELLEACGNLNIKAIAAHLNGETLHYNTNLKQGIALIIGNEANGISDNIAVKAHMLVKLPMFGNAESLNASVAAGILIYEAVRQRNMTNSIELN